MSDRVYLRIIGDVHGRITAPRQPKERNRRDLFPQSPYAAQRTIRRNYLGLIQQCTYSIQVGDLGHDYSQLATVDSTFHRVIAGNHDHLPALTTHFLGDFGMHSIPLRAGSFDFFFVRGAHSIDIPWRDAGVNWWPEEELDDIQAAAAISSFTECRPDIVISHDCPTEIVERVATLALPMEPSRTNQLLQACLERHAPSLWIFGHHHHNWSFDHPCGTRFVCVGELSFFDFDENGNPLYEVPR